MDPWHSSIESTVKAGLRLHGGDVPDYVWIGQHEGGLKKLGMYKSSGSPFTVDEGQMRMFCKNPNDSNVCFKDNSGGKFIRLGSDGNVFRFKKGGGSMVITKGKKCVIVVMAAADTPQKCEEVGRIVRDWLIHSQMESN